MLFQNLSFFLLCGLTWLVYWRLPAWRLVVLAIANVVFYLAAGWANLLIFLGASAATHVLGRHVTGRWGQAALALGIALNVANLALFKYAAFLMGSLHAAFPVPFLDPQLISGLLLPIGISFYTFQHISYLIDRRTRALPPAPNYLHFWVYISFFGHSVAGPIMRGHEFLPQVASVPRLTLDQAAMRQGLTLFALGLSKKLLVADNLSGPVDMFFARAATLSFAEAWVAAMLFAFQIYYDFSAYSDMAVGIGQIFGLSLTQNFRTPYLAASPGEFWRRWHVTLSAWIRDYVYIPLGGSRAGLARGLAASMTAMLVSGLWHGAAWTYVLWGAYHGTLLVGHRAWRAVRARLAWPGFEGRGYRAVAVAGFFSLTCVGWVLFRAASLADAHAMFRAMAQFDLASLNTVKRWLALGAGLAALHGLEALVREHAGRLGARWGRMPSPVRGLAYGSLVLMWMLVYASPKDFIYFKF